MTCQIVSALAALTMSGMGCQDEDAIGHDDGHGKGRGSEACQEWQDAICDYAADRCGALPRDLCDTQYRGVTCKSDAQANACVKQLDRSGCGGVMRDCVLDGVADPGPAARACGQLFRRFCERSVECGMFESVEACVAESTDIDCENAVAYDLDYDVCMEQIDTLECPIVKLPGLCEQVIVQRNVAGRE